MKHVDGSMEIDKLSSDDLHNLLMEEEESEDVDINQLEEVAFKQPLIFAKSEDEQYRENLMRRLGFNKSDKEDLAQDDYIREEEDYDSGSNYSNQADKDKDFDWQSIKFFRDKKELEHLIIEDTFECDPDPMNMKDFIKGIDSKMIYKYDYNLLSAKKGLEYDNFSKIDWISLENKRLIARGDPTRLSDIEEYKMIQESEKKRQTWLNEGAVEEEDTKYDWEKYKGLIRDLKNPETGPMFVYMGACWLTASFIGYAQGFKKSLLRSTKTGFKRIVECAEFSKPFVERIGGLGLRIGAIIGVSHLALDFIYGSNEMTRITSMGLGMLYYYKHFNSNLIHKGTLLTLFGMFSLSIFAMHEMRRTFNSYRGPDQLIAWLNTTTFNPMFRIFLDQMLGLNQYFYPEVYNKKKTREYIPGESPEDIIAERKRYDAQIGIQTYPISRIFGFKN